MTEERDVALKLLHTADWHLGMRFPSFSEDEQLTLMRARMEVIDRIAGVADSNDVDAVLCAGDLFDSPKPEEDWWKGLCARLAAASGRRPWVLLPGNHDPLVEGSVWDPEHPFRRALPEWVHVVDRDDFTLELTSDASLFAVPCRSASGDSHLVDKIPPREEGDSSIRVGMVHGQTFDVEGFSVNFPIPKNAAADRGVDYLAIGDTHAFREVPPGARYPTVYPSAPEPTKFGENDAGFVALVFFPRGRRKPIIRRERVGRWRWVEQECTSIEELRSLAASDDLRRTVLRLVPRMKLGAEPFAEAERLLRSMAGTQATHGTVGVLTVDREDFVLDTDDIEAAFEDVPDVLAAAIARLRQVEDTEEGPTARRALYHLYRLVKEAR